ncbi:MAG TPA: hypothetical protein VNO50_10800 [Pyrinomonadaceae bacterium]|nr:hypothetical protein [Pyrinomonadaceae bacterium]
MNQDTSIAIIPAPLQHKVQLSAVGARFTDLTAHEWKSLWLPFRRVRKAFNFTLGDWINHGKAAYGERYALALDTTELEYQTLRNFASTCSLVTLSRRRDKLDWSHHVEVGPLSPRDQTRFLKLAEENNWSVSDLRRAIRDEQGEVKEKALPPGFIPRSWVEEGVRWFRRQDVMNWDPERRASLKRELDPIVDLAKGL